MENGYYLMVGVISSFILIVSPTFIQECIDYIKENK